MTKRETFDAIMRRAVDDGFWEREIHYSTLRTTRLTHDVKKAKNNPRRIVIKDHKQPRWVDIRAINLVTMMVWDRGYAFDLIKEEVPNGAREMIDRYITVDLIDAPEPALRDEFYDVAVTREFIEHACNLAAFLAEDTRDDNYTFRLYRTLAEAETKLKVQTLSRQDKGEFYSWIGPRRIFTKNHKNVIGAKSAADVDW